MLYRFSLVILVGFALSVPALAGEFDDVDVTLYGMEDSKSAELSKALPRLLRQRMQAASLRETEAFEKVTTRRQWERYRDQRIAALRAALGQFPEPPVEVNSLTTSQRQGDGFVIHNLVYESRPGWWVTANLYLPKQPPEKMPGILLVHSHHTAKTHGELQDMGMTWARSGVAVIVPDMVGYGERREHDFHHENDYPMPYRVGRQDYYFRYNSNLLLSAIGDSLIGWMAWDIMRGIDVLLQQDHIDKDRLIVMGSVAGGGDPAGVAAALDSRVAGVVPFNFGGWQPESRELDNPDRDFAWFGEGYWESSRGIRRGAADGFAHFVIVGSVAPRKLIYAHEFAWDANTDPSWPRLQKIFRFYNAQGHIAVAYGAGTVRASGPGNTHCTHIGAVHRRMIYPHLAKWFQMPIPDEYSRRLSPDELRCWTKEAREKCQPKSLARLCGELAEQRRAGQTAESAMTAWADWLGDTAPIKVRAETVSQVRLPSATLSRWALPCEGLVLPVFLLQPHNGEKPTPAVVMVAAEGKEGFLKNRTDEIVRLLKVGNAVCLADLRGTGETRPGSSAARGSGRTSASQTSLILGQPMLGAQLRDLRTVIQWLGDIDQIDAERLTVWGDSFAPVNRPDVRLAVPYDLPSPTIGEPGPALLAMLAAHFEPGVKSAVARGGVLDATSYFDGPYLYVPHETVVPAMLPQGRLLAELLRAKGISVRLEQSIDAQNRAAK